MFDTPGYMEAVQSKHAAHAFPFDDENPAVAGLLIRARVKRTVFAETDMISSARSSSSVSTATISCHALFLPRNAPSSKCPMSRKQCLRDNPCEDACQGPAAMWGRFPANPAPAKVPQGRLWLRPLPHRPPGFDRQTGRSTFSFLSPLKCQDRKLRP